MQLTPRGRRSNFDALRLAFRHAIDRIWTAQGGSASYIGIAISGGVDSMALATLCSHYAHKPEIRFKGFIVDHGLRRGSDTEAEAVAAELGRIGLLSSVLRLNWSGHGDPKTNPNFESIARKLRYQAIGKACYEDRIQSLLVGHHADDQAETVLARLVHGYLGSGLQGIRSGVNLPECDGLYGVHQSGYPIGSDNGTEAAEGGGVRLYRPLLNQDKVTLTSLCQAYGTRWFEDETNNDLRLSVRNTLRHLLAGKSLPLALQKPAMLEVARRVSTKYADVSHEAAVMLKNCHIHIDVRSGRLRWWMPGHILQRFDCLEGDSGLEIKTEIVRQVLMMVVPKANVSNIELCKVTDAMFPTTVSVSYQPTGPIRACGINIEKSDGLEFTTPGENALHMCWTMTRAQPYAAELASPGIALSLSETSQLESEIRWTCFSLFDHRFWVRIGRPSTITEPEKVGWNISIRFLTPDLLARLRKSLRKPECHARLKEALKHVPGSARFVIPAIVAKKANVSEEAVQEVVALPSLGWSNTEAKSGRWKEWDSKSQTSWGTSGVSFVWKLHYRQIHESARLCEYA
ncbi:adenine nucleotide alpha hydrolases-like protein [Polychaeton citri CBS 116435]|uniref:tRNA(Ile)-lysidine synthetase n=1 Tax=Polychaeton citri CBS 116435 TaxID=1314669 RepID=A0A9P4Q638_9PEZI|nr:adenine nucleotide alpha hydrolases-like protein [Polychaeton citri CBS 116435]